MLIQRVWQHNLLAVIMCDIECYARQEEKHMFKTRMGGLGTVSMRATKWEHIRT